MDFYQSQAIGSVRFLTARYGRAACCGLHSPQQTIGLRNKTPPTAARAV